MPKCSVSGVECTILFDSESCGFSQAPRCAHVVSEHSFVHGSKL